MFSQFRLKGFHSKQVLKDQLSKEHSVHFHFFPCTMKSSNSYVMWHQCVTRPTLAGDLTHAICLCVPLFSPSSPLPFQRFYKVVRNTYLRVALSACHLFPEKPLRSTQWSSGIQKNYLLKFNGEIQSTAKRMYEIIIYVNCYMYE